MVTIVVIVGDGDNDDDGDGVNDEVIVTGISRDIIANLLDFDTI